MARSAVAYASARHVERSWWRRAESNRRHADFQRTPRLSSDGTSRGYLASECSERYVAAPAPATAPGGTSGTRESLSVGCVAPTCRRLPGHPPTRGLGLREAGFSRTVNVERYTHYCVYSAGLAIY